MGTKRHSGGAAYGNEDGVQEALEAQRQHPQLAETLTLQEAVEAILVELRVMNRHLEVITGESVDTREVENDVH